MFSEYFGYIQINFSYSKKILYLKKLFIFREMYKFTNLKFKLFRYSCRILVDILDIKKENLSND